MTKDTVDRAVKRGSGAQDGEDFEEITYEGYGPAGVAVLVLCLTDNRNRTVAEVRHAFSKAGGNLGTSGSVSYLFSNVGMIAMSEGTDEDALMDSALDAGADDVISNDDGSLEVLTTPETLMDVKEAIQQAGMDILHAESSMHASTLIALADVDSAQKFLRLVDRLEDLDDVQNVYSNADIPADIAEQL
jgi:YebC/PmpR family DNA-binding regulatory protein